MKEETIGTAILARLDKWIKYHREMKEMYESTMEWTDASIHRRCIDAFEIAKREVQEEYREYMQDLKR